MKGESRKPIVFQYKKSKLCRICGQMKEMFRTQKTCDECKDRAKKEKNVHER